MLEQYPKEVKLVFKHFPLRNHQFAMKAAIASLAAESQGKFWEFHDRLFDNYNQLSDAKIDAIAQETGLNPVEFQAKLKDPKIQAKIHQDQNDGSKAGVRGTPTIFINGRRLQNRTLEGFQEIIDNELDKLKKAEAGKSS